MYLVNVITSVPINPNKPTANGAIESNHKTIGQVVHAYCHLKPPQTAELGTTILGGASDHPREDFVIQLNSLTKRNLGLTNMATLINSETQHIQLFCIHLW